MGSRRWPERFWLTVAAAAALLALVALPAGCRAPAVALAEPWGAADPCGATATLDEAALGAALGYTADAPKDLDALAALIAAHPAPVELIEGGAGADDPVARAAAALGRPACRRPLAGRVRVQAGPVGEGRIARARPAIGVVAEKLVAAGRHLEAGEDAEARTRAAGGGGVRAGAGARARCWRSATATPGRAAGARRRLLCGGHPAVSRTPLPGGPGLGRAQREGERRLGLVAATSRALALFPGDQATRAVMAERPVHHLAGAGRPARAARRATGALADGGGEPNVRSPGPRPRPTPAAGRASAAPGPARRLAAPARSCRPALEPGRGERLHRPVAAGVPGAPGAGARGRRRTGRPDRGGPRGADGRARPARRGRPGPSPRLLWLIDEARRTRLFGFVERYRVMPRRDVGWLFP